MTLKLFFTYFGHAILLCNFGKMLVGLSRAISWRISPWIPKPLFWGFFEADSNACFII